MCFSYFIKTSTSNYDSKYDPVFQEGDNGIKTAFDLAVGAGPIFAHTLFFSHKIRIPIASPHPTHTHAHAHPDTHTSSGSAGVQIKLIFLFDSDVEHSSDWISERRRGEDTERGREREMKWWRGMFCII